MQDIIVDIFYWIGIDPAYLQPANILLTILIIVTIVVGFFPLIIYLLQRHKIPSLEIEEIFINGISTNDILPTQYYCLRIRRKGGEGRAEGCEGFLTIENKLDTKTRWWLHDKTHIDISKWEDLILFRLENNGQLINFPSLSKKDDDSVSNSIFPNPAVALNEYSDEKLLVEIDATRGRIPKRQYARRIKDIIDDADHKD